MCMVTSSYLEYKVDPKHEISETKKIFNINDFYEESKWFYPSVVDKTHSVLSPLVEGYGHFKFTGYCEVCKDNSSFETNLEIKPELEPSKAIGVNFREGLICTKCKLNSRQRFVFSQLNNFSINSNVYIQEQCTSFYQHAKKSFPNLVGSEYISDEARPGEIINSIRHEDAMNLSFAANSFDVVISNDVLEHIPNPQKALQEIFRILSPKGVAIITTPFFINNEKTVQRAEIIGGDIIHRGTPRN